MASANVALPRLSVLSELCYRTTDASVTASDNVRMQCTTDERGCTDSGHLQRALLRTRLTGSGHVPRPRR
jgi:hypothetical protein